MITDRVASLFRFATRGAPFLVLVLSALPAHSQAPLAAPPGMADSATGAAPAPAPALEVVDLSAQAAFTEPSARVGDSLDYVLTVEWPESPVQVVVLAPDSVDFQGFKLIGQATAHKKAASGADGKVGIVNRSIFTYRLRAETPGGGKAGSLKLRYLTGLSRNEQSHFIPTAHLDIAPARTPLVHSAWFRVAAGLLAFGLAAGIAWLAFRAAARRPKAKGPAKTDLRPEVLALKPRLRGGDSKAILMDMEALAARWLRQELGEDPSASPAPKFDPLLDRYLAGNGAAAPEWAGLRELFRHARFGGGHKEPHELQDAYRALKKCLKITDEPGED